MQTYSQDLRDRVLRALERGEGPTQIARRLEVSRQWVYLVNNRFQADGVRSGLQRGGYRKSRVAQMEPTVREWLKKDPGLTLAQLCQRLEQHDILIKAPALWHQMNKWGLSLKKNPARQRARKAGRTEVTA